MTDEQLWRGYVRERGLVCKDMHVVKDAFMRALSIGRGDDGAAPVVISTMKKRIDTEIKWLRSDSCTKDMLPDDLEREKLINEFERHIRISGKTHSSIYDVRTHFFNWISKRNERRTTSTSSDASWRDETLDRMRRLVNPS